MSPPAMTAAPDAGTPTERLTAVLARIAEACQASGRRPEEITLVAVSKGMSSAAVVELLRAGVEYGLVDLGENKAQELIAKSAEVADLSPPRPPSWHFVGQLQRNKAAAVAGVAAMVHSVDRSSLVRALARAALDRGELLPVLIQVDFDPDLRSGRGGARTAEVPDLAEQIAAADSLVLSGVMTVAPRDVEPARAFADLAAISTALIADHPAATVISAGMSNDLEKAVAAGATLLRVGTALFGDRRITSEDRAAGTR